MILQRIEQKLDRVLRLLGTEIKDMADVQAQIAALQTQVQKNEQVEGSALVLIQGLVRQLQAAQNAPDVGAALGEVITGLQTSAQPLAEAVAANTPAGQAS